jgi:hypothetical protein
MDQISSHALLGVWLPEVGNSRGNIVNEDKQHLENLRKLLEDCQKGKDSWTIHKMIYESCALAVVLAEKLDRTSRRVVRLTWVLLALTAVLLLIEVLHLFHV